MLSLLTDESGTTVHIEEIADPIAPAIKINKKNNFIDNFVIFLIDIENQYKI